MPLVMQVTLHCFQPEAMLHTQETHPLLAASYLQSCRIVPRAYHATNSALQNGFENNASAGAQLRLFTLL